MYFLTLEEALAGLRGNRDAVFFQRLLVSPELASGRRQEGNITRPARALFAVVRVEDRLTADQARTSLRNRLGLAVTLLRRIRLAVIARRLDVERDHRRACGALRQEGVEGLKARLAVFCR